MPYNIPYNIVSWCYRVPYHIVSQHVIHPCFTILDIVYVFVLKAYDSNSKDCIFDPTCTSTNVFMGLSEPLSIYAVHIGACRRQLLLGLLY